ncbi:hypothetical protein H6S82_07035 [Planktothrix sp. FACHB-1355]|nr:hypothetical protein [Planktothrix sp. FACHB-1355]
MQKQLKQIVVSDPKVMMGKPLKLYLLKPTHRRKVQSFVVGQAPEG